MMPYGMHTSRYSDMWHYLDPDGREHTQEQFQNYLSKNYPKQGDWDYSTHAEAERRLTEVGGWRKVKQTYKMLPFEEVKGKFLVVSQFVEPRSRDGNPINYKDLTQEDWDIMQPDVYNLRSIQWGHSTWEVLENGELKFTGADYDSSG